MERVRDCVSSAGMFIFGVLLCPALKGVWSFNLYAEHPAVYGGPSGSYFGYSVDFYQASTDSNTISVLVGAPKANTSQPGIVEAGAVYYCPWSGPPDSCRQIPFDNSNNRMMKVNGTREPVEFKSHQWFGASVRTHKGKVVACAPLYHWRTVKLSADKEPVGTCYVAVQNFSAYAEYSPCRTNDPDPEGQGFCQAGFSVDFTKVKTAMASYFGYAVAVTDLNGDGTDDVLVGAPLYMEREMESKPREVGRVYLYLQMAPLTFSKPVALTGTHTFGRFGTAIAPLGDVNQDGYNDVAVGCPFGGEERGGRVLIFNGNRDVTTQGLTLSQELRAARTSSVGLPGYGFSLRGGQDLDNNQYPDLIVGAFGAAEVLVYSVSHICAFPKRRDCQLKSAWLIGYNMLSLLLLYPSPDLRAELQLDWLKGARGGTKRVLFLDSQQPQHMGLLRLGHDQPRACLSYTIYLREEDEFRDKLTPISLALNYSLATPLHSQSLPPVLNHYSSTFLQDHAYILLDCGDDNICIPDLQLSASIDRSELVIGNDNLVMLTITALNRGEGAYETELHTLIPPEADYIGVERRVESLAQPNCEYKMVNESRMVVCDLGNPMVAGTELSVGLRFSVQRLEDAGPKISFELQIHRVSHPSQVVLPFPRWEPKEKPVKEDDVGPQVTHIYEVNALL
uniref:Integrin alpha-2 domain-containing protein n=1 Tax=Anabas testudineus TaxID=64144 RepID=A0A7N6C1S0_ANATE